VSPEKLKRILDALPETPGVYFMKDAQGRTLYIGKAKNLKNRVCTYFHDSYGDPRIRTMVSKVEEIEVLQAPSEVDALLMEARLIKDIQPRYNDRLKDDKSFTMLALTQFDDFPKVWVVRETDEINAETYGPFTSAGNCATPSASSRDLQVRHLFHRDARAIKRKPRPCLLHAISLPRCADRICATGTGATSRCSQVPAEAGRWSPSSASDEGRPSAGVRAGGGITIRSGLDGLSNVRSWTTSKATSRRWIRATDWRSWAESWGSRRLRGRSKASTSPTSRATRAWGRS
jgi:hypothetical protein